MKRDVFNKLFLVIIAFLLLLNFMQGIFSTNTVMAEKNNEQVGRYQISAWASQSGRFGHHNGYYIVDTVTGKVVDSKSEVHTTKE